MSTKKIAVVTDSCTDVPKDFIEKYGIYVLPVIVQYSDRAYLDRVEITEADVYQRLAQEVPTTSLPTPEQIVRLFDQIVADGYDTAVVVTMSSGLSGTHNAIRLMAEEYTGLDVHMMDTKNIGIGAGFGVMAAAELVTGGAPLEEVLAGTQDSINHTKIFFSLKTLEYLRKGGRIGLVTGIIGNVLNLKPIISCNEDGIYYNVKVARGEKQSLKELLRLAKEYAAQYDAYNVAVCDGDAPEEAEALLKTIREHFPNAKNVYHTHVSPALVVHTGPGLIGIGIQKI
ncbi:MAG: DegV family protein [Oscillospiraceae bacterium]|jgi:DegV family protein with EDD domain|nr:DegV family protein [Oscillospiraceae bacterium]